MWGFGGAEATYRMKLTKNDDQLSGSYTGVLAPQFHDTAGILHLADDINIMGDITGTVDTHGIPRKDPLHLKIKSEEHPRLIFRGKISSTSFNRFNSMGTGGLARMDHDG